MEIPNESNSLLKLLLMPSRGYPRKPCNTSSTVIFGTCRVIFGHFGHVSHNLPHFITKYDDMKTFFFPQNQTVSSNSVSVDKAKLVTTTKK